MDTLVTLRTTKSENQQLKDRFQKVCTRLLYYLVFLPFL